MMEQTTAPLDDSPPHRGLPGPLGWARRNLFGSPVSALLTVIALYVIYLLVPPFLDWAIFSANFQAGTSRADCVNPGACWTMVRARFGQFVYGFYPEDQRWRVDLAALLLIVGAAGLLVRRVPGKRWFALFVFVILPPLALWLLYGGLGLAPIETRLWGGLMLTVIVGMSPVASLPVGIVLALGRRSEMPVVRLICTAFIEFIRAVPLITILFMSSVMLPLFLPEGVTFDKLLRALIGYTLFGAAYMAEVVRGGLQAIPKGQYEGAHALGLNYGQTTGLIILPQALKISIPGLVNSFIGQFMDSTLITIIGLFELLGIVQAAARDPNWAGLSKEGFVFAGVIYFIICYSMSRYSVGLERRLHTGHKR
ncbi:MAG: amino acid ABC transporter permease [Dongiaceae bacterium]